MVIDPAETLLPLLWAVLKLVLHPPHPDPLLLSEPAMDLDLLRALKLNLDPEDLLPPLPPL